MEFMEKRTSHRYKKGIEMSFLYREATERFKRSKSPLLKINQIIDWDKIRKILERKENPKQRGQRPYNRLSLFKAIFFLGQYYNLSDPEREHSISMRFHFIAFTE